MGYTSNQMKTIFDTSSSTKLTYLATISADFTNQYLNTLQYSDLESEVDIKRFYRNSLWNTENYPNLSTCISSNEINDVDYCDTEKMIDYQVVKYKNLVKQEIPTATFSFNDCSGSDLMCLTVAWSGASNAQADCKINTTTCYYLEF
jgi:hypothetical protein